MPELISWCRLNIHFDSELKQTDFLLDGKPLDIQGFILTQQAFGYEYPPVTTLDLVGIQDTWHIVED